MTEQYNNAVATHYAAFRPPLHRIILERVLHPDERFVAGLDVGCGTGYSAVALAKYCDQVFGLDPSESMLERSQKHPKITYIRGSGEELEILPVQSFDIITFAGALFYTKTKRLRQELLRVCKPGGTILVYDFEVLLSDLMAEFGLTCRPVASDYNHAVNLSGWTGFRAETERSERVQLKVSATELAHILLADSNRYDAFLDRFDCEDPFGSIVQQLKQRSTNAQLEADIYFSRYTKE